MQRRALVTLVALTLALSGAAACGGDGDEPAAGGSTAGPTTVKVGLVPITAVAPVYLGIKQGFFAEERLKVEPQLAEGGAAIVPAVQSGAQQIGFSNSVSLMIAQTRGLPIKVVAPGEVAADAPREDNSALMVLRDSDIRSPKDLAGKRIGVNTLKNIAGLTTEAALSEQGVDPKSLKLVEVPFPEMLKSLESGNIDAGFFNEPFTSQAKASGARTIVRPYTATRPGLPIAPYFATAKWIESNRDVLERFQRAMRKSTRYAIDNPEAVRRVITEYTEIPRKAAQRIRLPHLATTLEPAGFQALATLVERFGYAEEKPNAAELLADAGGA